MLKDNQIGEFNILTSSQTTPVNNYNYIAAAVITAQSCFPITVSQASVAIGSQVFSQIDAQSGFMWLTQLMFRFSW